MRKTDEPCHVSRPSWRSLGQEYRIYRDRIEIDSLFGRKTIPVADIDGIEVRRPPVIADIFRGKPLSSWLALKFDLADLYPHVAIQLRKGVIRNLRITPEDPEDFVAGYHACRKQP